MSQFPRLILALAFAVLLPALGTMMFLLFGAGMLGTPSGVVMRTLLYIGAQFLWILPIVAFFYGLDLHRRGFEKWGVGILCAGGLIDALTIWLLTAHS